MHLNKQPTMTLDFFLFAQIVKSLKKKKMVIFLQRRTALAIANENFRESFKQRKDEFDHLSRLVEG